MKFTIPFSVDEPTDVGCRKGVVVCEVECHPVTNRVRVVAFIARDHRETVRQIYLADYPNPKPNLTLVPK